MTALVARWRRRHAHDPVLVTTFAEIDALIRTLLDEPTGRIAVELRLHATVRDDARRMLVGIHGRDLVGGIALAMSEDPAGFWYSQGKPKPDGARVSYPWMGVPHWFPAGCRIGIDEVASRGQGLADQQWLPASGRGHLAALAGPIVRLLYDMDDPPDTTHQVRVVMTALALGNAGTSVAMLVWAWDNPILIPFAVLTLGMAITTGYGAYVSHERWIVVSDVRRLIALRQLDRAQAVPRRAVRYRPDMRRLDV
jgi:hypothetical protein